MSRSTIWSVLVFLVFAFATAIVFFWIRDGSLREAGTSMDNLLSSAGENISDTTGELADSTGNVIERATDGDDRT